MKDIDQLFGELRRSEPYLSDAGFASAVMAQLPRRRELPVWEKNLLLLAATVAGSAVVAWQLPAVELVSLITSMRLNVQVIVAAVTTVYLFSYGAIWVAERN